MQWKNEIEAYTDGLKIAIWHGAAREGNIKELVKYDIVRRYPIFRSDMEALLYYRF